MNLKIGRAKRPLLATPGVVAALIASGCVGIISDTADQLDIIGDVAVTTGQCIAPADGSARGAEQGGERPLCLGISGEVPGGDRDVQLLLAYQIPQTSKAPDTIAAAGTIERFVPGQNDRGGVPGQIVVEEREFTYRASSSYTAELEELDLNDGLEAEPGMRWVGYISDRQTATNGDDAYWSSTARFTLPSTEAGQPFRGPFRYRTIVGYRNSLIEGGDATRPVDCQQTGTSCRTDRAPEAEPTRGSAPPAPASTDTRDLAVAPGGGPVDIVAGQGGDVPFVLRYAGATSPQAFRLTSSTSLAGSPATPAPATFPATTNQEGTVNVRVDVPAGAPLGLQNVELVAALPNGQHRRATAQFNVVAAPVTTTASQVIATPARTCASRRSFTIRLRQRKRDPLVSAVVRLNGKKVKTVKRSRITAPVTLKGLPKGRFTVKITAKTRSGKSVTGTRRYRTCTPKQQGGIPKL